MESTTLIAECLFGIPSRLHLIQYTSSLRILWSISSLNLISVPSFPDGYWSVELKKNEIDGVFRVHGNMKT
jgi:hypothetical protein